MPSCFSSELKMKAQRSQELEQSCQESSLGKTPSAISSFFLPGKNQNWQIFDSSSSTFEPECVLSYLQIGTFKHLTGANQWPKKQFYCIYSFSVPTALGLLRSMIYLPNAHSVVYTLKCILPLLSTTNPQVQRACLTSILSPSPVALPPAI